MFLFYLFLISSVLLGCSSIKDEVLLDFPLGKVKGKIRTTVTGVTVHSFQGIPFAEPVVNESRFQVAEPKKPWTSVLDATTEGSFCRQITYTDVAGDEDCLFMNIFSPKDPKLNESLPVMVFIYGGGFIEGASVEVNYGPDYLLDYEVVVVTFNYRIGPFGFFSTGDDVVPGNMGLKDQVLALQFVNKYIQYFGGDPNKVTIFGQSAGAASVHYHVLSPLSKGLFRAAICESASALSVWANQKNQTELSYLLATIINPEFATKKANSSEIYEYLIKQPADVIDRAAHQMHLMEKPSDIQIHKGVYWGPVVEHKHKDAFISEPMYEMLKNGHVNDVKLLIGVNSEEMLPTDTDSLVKTIAEFENDLELLVPNKLNNKDSDKAIIAQKIKDFYSPYINFSVNERQFVKYQSDQCFARSILKAAELESRWHDVYVYEFEYHGPLGKFADTPVIGFSDDVRHTEEISYILCHSYPGLNTTDVTNYPIPDQIVQKRMTTLFSNFAKYLNPTPEKIDILQNITWPTVKPDNFQYLAIGSWMEVRKNPMENMYRFWNDIFSTYGQEPFISY